MSCTETIYKIGNIVVCEFDFRNPAASNALVDPTNVFAAVKNPNGTITIYTYGIHAAVVKTGVGEYYVEINVNMAGTWKARGYSTGTFKGSEETTFEVAASEFA